MINNSDFTHKAQEAIINARSIAQQKSQQQIDALHLLLALLSQEEGMVLILLQKLGIDIEDLKKRTERAVSNIPTIVSPQSFGQFYLTQDMAKVLTQAKQEAIEMGDEFISVEHLFLALIEVKTKAKEILDETVIIGKELNFNKLSRDSVSTILNEIRG